MLPAITDEIAAIEGAVPSPATNRASASPQNPDTSTAATSPRVMTSKRAGRDQGLMGRCPIANPPIMEPRAEMARMIPPSSEPSPNQATTAASMAAREPISSRETRTMSSTEGFANTFPKRPVARGIRRPRTAGTRMNSIPPASWIPVTTRRAATVPRYTTSVVITTGPKTQMISCSAASRLNSGVTRCCGTSFG